MSNVVGSLVVNLLAKTADFVLGLKGAAKGVDDFASHIGKMASKIGGEGFGKLVEGLMGVKGLGAIGGAFSAKKLFDEFRVTAAAMDQAADAAERMQIGLKTFLDWKRVSEDLGIGVDAIEGGMRKMLISIDKASAGGKEQVQAFNELGISVSTLIGLQPEEAFKRLAAALTKVQDPAHRLRLEMELLGKGGPQLDAALRRLATGRGSGVTEQNAKTLAGVGSEFEKFGHEIKDTTVNAFGFLARFIASAFPTTTLKPEETAPAVIGRAAEEAAGFIDGLQQKIDKLKTGDDRAKIESWLRSPIKDVAARGQKAWALYQQIEREASKADAQKEVERILEGQKSKSSLAEQYINAARIAMPYSAKLTGKEEDRIDAMHKRLQQEEFDRMGREADLKEADAGRAMASKVQGMLATPLQEYENFMADLNRAQSFITPLDFAQAGRAAQDKLMKELAGKEPQLAGAAVWGTREGYSAAARFAAGLDSENLAKENLETVKAQLEIQREIAENTRTQANYLGIAP